MRKKGINPLALLLVLFKGVSRWGYRKQLCGAGGGSLQRAEEGREAERELNPGESREPGACDYGDNKLPGRRGAVLGLVQCRSLGRRMTNLAGQGKLLEKYPKIFKILVFNLVFCAFAVVRKLISLTSMLLKPDSFSSKAGLIFCGALH